MSWQKHFYKTKIILFLQSIKKVTWARDKTPSESAQGIDTKIPNNLCKDNTLFYKACTEKYELREWMALSVTGKNKLRSGMAFHVTSFRGGALRWWQLDLDLTYMDLRPLGALKIEHW